MPIPPDAPVMIAVFLLDINNPSFQAFEPNFARLGPRPSQSDVIPPAAPTTPGAQNRRIFHQHSDLICGAARRPADLPALPRPRSRPPANLGWSIEVGYPLTRTRPASRRHSRACSGPNNSVTAPTNDANSRSARRIWSAHGELSNDSSEFMAFST